MQTKDGRRLDCDAGCIMRGGKTIAGLARYCNDAGRKKTNVIWTAKSDRVQTWGARVLPGKVIEKGDEIFIEYGDVYWKTDCGRSCFAVS